MIQTDNHTGLKIHLQIDIVSVHSSYCWSLSETHFPQPFEGGRKAMKFLSVLFISIALVIFTWSFAFSEPWSATQKEIWNLEEIIWECYKKKDWKRLLNLDLLHEDSVAWLRGKMFPTNKAETRLHSEKWLNYDKPTSYKIIPLAIQVFDNIAIVCYIYRFKGNIVSDSGRAIHTWMKQDGEWKVIGFMNASNLKLPKHSVQ